MGATFELISIGPELPEHSGPVSTASIHLPGAETRHWRSGNTTLQEEILPTIGGTVYCYDFQIEHHIQAHVKVNESFIQLYHMMEITGKGKLTQQGSAIDFALLNRRGVYLYTPADYYTVQLEKGRYLVYGFCFDPEIQIGKNSQLKTILKPLLDGYYNNGQHLVASIPFRAEEYTRAKHLEIFEMLQEGKSSQAICFSKTLDDVFEISIKKLIPTFEMHHPSRIFIDSAREMIVQHFGAKDEDIAIKQIAINLQCSSDYLHNLHTRHYGISLISYKQGIRLEKAKRLLMQKEKLTYVALSCGFYDQSAFSKFFKQETGSTPKMFQMKYLK
ncbi:helix-turn-helix transcriptional regulator [Sphingobacterium sp. SG20118]|uniref:helix-turn-helix transcriptional regulator n=1 Tax=Sphingobacterium sp. SG20118 TaxID=3367156 RepID=UPI0037DFC58E